MTYYTPPELRRQLETFDIVLTNPPFSLDTAPGKTMPATRLLRVLIARLLSFLEPHP